MESFRYSGLFDSVLKALLVIIVLLAGLGYAWYADWIPFGTETGKRLTAPSIENLQQLSNVITSDDHKIIHYSFGDVPDVPDKQIPIKALKKAIQVWEQNNPNLEFMESENSNIEIRWQKYASSTHTGLATCNSVLFGILKHCILDISVGSKDCNSNFIQNDENMVVNILMHEMGHALGLGHTNEENHLMYSTKSIQQPDFDTKGYTIPERLEELYVGQKLLLTQESELQLEIESLEKRIIREEAQYDEYYKQYEQYEGRTLSAKEYDKYQPVYEKINAQVEKINDLIDQQNKLIGEINGVLDQLGCNPNFEITP